MATQILTIGAIFILLLVLTSSNPIFIEWLSGIRFVPPPFTPIAVNPLNCRDCSKSLVSINTQYNNIIETYDESLQYTEYMAKIYSSPLIRLLNCCQAQPQLNSTQLQPKLRLRLALIPLSPATRPPPHPATRKSRLSQTFQSLLDQLES